MRTKLIYVFAGLLVILVGTQVWSTLGTKGTPQQPYTVVRTIGDLEVRHYPAALSAMVVRPGTSYREMSSAGFRSLAGYIFGGNAEERKIAMTAPVHMEAGTDSTRMRFIMPEGLTLDSLPVPDDASVHLEPVPEETVAALRFGGFADDERIAVMSDRLLEEVRMAGLQVLGPVRFLGYDPPWQLVARRNEVIVAVSGSAP